MVGLSLPDLRQLSLPDLVDKDPLLLDLPDHYYGVIGVANDIGNRIWRSRQLFQGLPFWKSNRWHKPRTCKFSGDSKRTDRPLVNLQSLKCRYVAAGAFAPSAQHLRQHPHDLVHFAILATDRSLWSANSRHRRLLQKHADGMKVRCQSCNASGIWRVRDKQVVACIYRISCDSCCHAFSCRLFFVENLIVYIRWKDAALRALVIHLLHCCHLLQTPLALSTSLKWLLCCADICTCLLDTYR